MLFYQESTNIMLRMWYNCQQSSSSFYTNLSSQSIIEVDWNGQKLIEVGWNGLYGLKGLQWTWMNHIDWNVPKWTEWDRNGLKRYADVWLNRSVIATNPYLSF